MSLSVIIVHCIIGSTLETHLSEVVVQLTQCCLYSLIEGTTLASQLLNHLQITIQSINFIHPRHHSVKKFSSRHNHNYV